MSNGNSAPGQQDPILFISTIGGALNRVVVLVLRVFAQSEIHYLCMREKGRSGEIGE